MIDSDCPRCGSRNTKALAVLHDDGTRDTQFRRTGWFYYRRSFGLHSSRTQGQTQSLTAKLASPPSTGFMTTGGVAVFLFVSTALGGTVGFWTGLTILVLLAIFGSDSKARQQQLHEWSSTFRCGRCGTVFVIVEHDENQHGHAVIGQSETDRRTSLGYATTGRSLSTARPSAAYPNTRSDSASR